MNITSFLLNVLTGTLSNILTFLLFTSVTKTRWFQKLLEEVTKDFDFVKMQRRIK